MALNLASLTGYTDQISFELVSQAVAGSTLDNYVTLKSGYSAGTIAIPILSSNINPLAAGCNFTTTGATTSITQVDVVVLDLQQKETFCPEDMRAYFTSFYLSPSAYLKDLPFAEQIGALKARQIGEYNETLAFDGSGAMLGLKVYCGATSGAIAQTVATAGLTAAAWTAANAIAQAQAMVSALPSNVLNRQDLVMYASNKSYNAFNQALYNANLFHYTPGAGVGTTEGERFTIIPGTNVKLVPFNGLGSSNRVFVGPSEFIYKVVGLMDEGDQFQLIYDPYADIVRFTAKWRIGFNCAFPAYFVSNEIA